MNNCIFCKIINKEIPSITVYEDDFFKAIMDISPAAKGHIILISKKHFANIFELDEATSSQAVTVAAKIAKAMKEELNCDGINLLQNNGEAAGQTVFHFHMHLIPRYDNDTIKLTWKQSSYEAGEAAGIAEAIAKRI